jgi:hypothetical protein
MSHTDRIRLVYLGDDAASARWWWLLQGEPGVRCYYASRTGVQARRSARSLRAAGWFHSWAAALADERMSAVVIAAARPAPLGVALAALRARKHVIVPEPGFVTAAAWDEVAAAASAAGRRVFVASPGAYAGEPGAELLMLRDFLLSIRTGREPGWTLSGARRHMAELARLCARAEPSAAAEVVGVR